ncbi:MAG: protein translocase subunit SecD, partial [Acidobacteriia bacterium]|nr:protein translocase subunit SecD [Terriglobia bacterium]
MSTNIRTRTVTIIAVILACVFGIIGFPKSLAQLRQNWDNNIRLGLDLKGGSRLVLQVQVQDAAKAEADQTIERLKDDLKKQNISWASIDRNDPQTVGDTNNIQVTIKGIPATQTSAFRNLITERYAEWVMTAENSTDYDLRMKPSELVNLKRDTVEREIQTISNRINQLGLTEPTVQQYGRSGDDYQIL